MSRRFSYIGPVDIVRNGHDSFHFEWAEMAEHVEQIDAGTFTDPLIESVFEWRGTARTVGNRIPNWLANHLGTFEVLLDDKTTGAIGITSVMYCNSVHSITFTGIGAIPS